MRVRLQTLFLVMTWLAVAFAVLGPRLAKWWSESPKREDDSRLTILKPHCEGVAALAFSTDGKYLASAHAFLEEVGSRSSMAGVPPAFVMLWDVQERGNLARFQVSDRSYQSIRFSGDGRKLVIASQGELMFWDIQGQTLERTGISGICELSPDSSVVAIPSEPAGYTIIKTSDQNVVAKLATEEGSEAWAISADSKLLAVGYRWPGPKRIEIWNIENAKVQTTLPSTIGSRMCASFSPDGKLFLCGSIDGIDVSVFDCETGALRAKFPLVHGPVWCLAFSPNGRLLAVGGEVGEVHWWDVATGGKQGSIVDKSTWGITALAFSPDSSQLAIGNGEGKIQIMQVAN